MQGAVQAHQGLGRHLRQVGRGGAKTLGGVVVLRIGPDVVNVAAAPALARGAGPQGPQLQVIAGADGLGRVPGQIVAPRRRPDRP
ncbi:hypothetical protein D3C80_1196860 [compost metagenome]